MFLMLLRGLCFFFFFFNRIVYYSLIAGTAIDTEVKHLSIYSCFAFFFFGIEENGI